MHIRGRRRALCLLVPLTLAALATPRVAAQVPCADPDAEIQLILQRDAVAWSPELFAGQIRTNEIVVEPGIFDITVGVVSQLPADGAGLQNWNIYADVTGDLYIVDADVIGTAAADITDDPPGFVDSGFVVVEVGDREPHGRFAIGVVTFSLAQRITLDPVGTASAFRLHVAAENHATGSVRILPRLGDGDGGAASHLPCCSQAVAGGVVYDLTCAQEVDVRVVDTSRGCASRPADARAPIDVSWQQRYDFYPASSGATSLAMASDGGAVATGTHAARSAWFLKTDAAGEVAWVRLIEREESLDLYDITATSDGAFVATGETSAARYELYLVKLRGDGSVAWERVSEENARLSGRAIAETRGGHFVIAGTTGAARIYLTRTDSSGEPVFARRLGDGIGEAICEDPTTESIVVAGQRDDEAVILKTTADGEPLWERTIAPEAPYDHALFRDVLVSAEGEYVVAGSCRTGIRPSSPERSVVLLAAYDPDGAPTWQRVIEPDDWIRDAYSLSATPDGGFLVAGLAELFEHAQFYLVKFDADRNLLWQTAFGERRLGLGVADAVVADDGSAVVAGYDRLRGNRPWIARVEPVETGQLPSDLNQDGRLDLSDGVCLLSHLFGTGSFLWPCGDGAGDNPANVALVDGNGDGRIDISDGIAIFSYLFFNGAPPVLGEECVAIEGCAGVCEP